MGRRGNIVVVLLFMLLLVASGLALLTHTDLHVKVVAARRERRLGSAALGQALLLSLHRFREKLAAADMNAFPGPESDYFDEDHFPASEEGGFLSRHSFSHFTLREAGAFRVTRVLDLIRVGDVTGRLAGAARAGVDLLSGDVPAGEIGLLVARRSDAAPGAFLSSQRVDYAGAQLPQVGDYSPAMEPQSLLAEALGLPLGVPDWRRLRERFGLEVADAPIPPGVYLARDEKDIRAVFVEGDLEKIVFSAAGNWQSIVFSCNGRDEELRYRPGLGSVAWSGTDGLAVDGFSFAERIIVHGSVWDIEQAGAAAFLPAARIELLASGRLVVRSRLESESLAAGRVRLPCLLLLTVGRDFLSDEEVDADVAFDVEGSAVVQVQVISAGSLVNGRAGVEITGSLAARDIENAGTLRVNAAKGSFALDDHVLLRGFKFLTNFRVHFIEENGNEE